VLQEEDDVQGGGMKCYRKKKMYREVVRNVTGRRRCAGR
jgi:hypothetical protein